MPDWTISIGGALATFIATFSVLKQKVNVAEKRDDEQDEAFKAFKTELYKEIALINKFISETRPAIEHYNRIEVGYGKKLDVHSEAITMLSQQVTQSPTMKEVREEFVTKEMYQQMQKHIDEKFDKLEASQSRTNEMLHEILHKLSRS